MTKTIKSSILIAVLSAATVSPAWADRYERHDRGHGHRGGEHSRNVFGWGLGLLAGTAIILAATSQPRVYSPPLVVEPIYPQRPVIVRPSVSPAPVYAQQQDYWYYCADAGSYYPYVQSCPAGWMKVLPN